MRRKIYRMPREAAVEMLRRAEVIRLAGTTQEGAPLLRVVHGIVMDDCVAFHGASAGEKMEAIGREVVLSAEEIVTTLPSYFMDPNRACPATTFYESVQVRGVLEEVVDPVEKAAMLQALMERYQPEGGYVPITADDPLYEKVVRGILLARVSLEHISGKQKMGQNKTPKQLAGVMTSMWRRGLPSDPGAIELIRAANPKADTPDFLVGPEGSTLFCELGEEAREEALPLLCGAYWNAWSDEGRIGAALEASDVRVGARDGDGRLIAVARAITDRSRRAWVYDVMVEEAWRGRGVGEALMRLLLDHPLVRDTEVVMLSTKDAMTFYERLGFEDVREAQLRPWRSTMMVLARSGVVEAASARGSAL